MVRLALLLLLALTPPAIQAIEEPACDVVRQIDDPIELRRYAADVVAEMVLDATAADPGNQAFPILAGYIFGKNMGQRKLEMTAPVTQSAVTGGMRVQVVLPKGVTLALR